jgi:hypothetical protein
MRSDLHDDPAVFRLASMLNVDRFSVVGRLHAFWAWADKHAVDGHVDGATTQLVDTIVTHPGFADALLVVGWLLWDDKGISIPRYERHNGKTAKERAQKNQRQAKWRSGGAPVDGRVDAAPSTREEKRREEVTTKRGGKTEVPDWVPKDAWGGYVEMRAKKHPMTERAKALAISKLDALRTRGFDPAAVLDEATEKSWRGIYEPRDTQPIKRNDFADCR